MAPERAYPHDPDEALRVAVCPLMDACGLCPAMQSRQQGEARLKARLSGRRQHHLQEPDRLKLPRTLQRPGVDGTKSCRLQKIGERDLPLRMVSGEQNRRRRRAIRAGDERVGEIGVERLQDADVLGQLLGEFKCRGGMAQSLWLLIRCEINGLLMSITTLPPSRFR